MNSGIQVRSLAAGFLAAVASFATGSRATAGPTWELDYTEDAGQLASSAQFITASLDPMINIYGRLGGAGFVTSDYVDMYLLEITSPTMVTISTAGGDGGGSAGFDTQLFIFKRKGIGNNVRALALRANNDAAPGNSGSRVGSEGDPSQDYTVLGRGFYFLAIAGVGTTALDHSGQAIWDDLSSPGITVSGFERSLADWAGNGAVGEYHIRLMSVGGAAPAPGAIALLGIAGLVGRRRR